MILFDGKPGSRTFVRRRTELQNFLHNFLQSFIIKGLGGSGIKILFDGRSGSRSSVRRRTEFQSFIQSLLQSFIIKGLRYLSSRGQTKQDNKPPWKGREGRNGLGGGWGQWNPYPLPSRQVWPTPRTQPAKTAGLRNRPDYIPWLPRGYTVASGYPAATPWMPSVAEARTGPPGSFSLFTCVYQECAENQSGIRPKLLSFWVHPALVLGPRQKGRGSPVTTPWLPRGFPVATPGAATTLVNRMPALGPRRESSGVNLNCSVGGCAVHHIGSS